MDEHNHATWLKDGMEGADADMQQAYKYFMRPDPNQRQFVGPIQTGWDEVTGRKMRWRDARIGMLRNTAEENLKPMRVYLDPLPHVRLEAAKQLQGWYQAKQTEENSTHRPRPCYTDAMLTSPYQGYCTVGCAFCYVNSGMRGYRGSGLVSVPMNYGEQVAGMLSKLKTSAAGYFSSFTDPFLPLESYYHNTQNGAMAFVEEGLPVFFLSRLKYPDWAVELLQMNKYSYAQKSINCPDPELWAKLSPGAMPLNDHMKDIKRLKKAGIYVSIQCNPIVPGVVNHKDVVRLFEKLSNVGADHVIIKFVEAGYSWADTMASRIEQRFGPEKGGRFRELFTQNIGGQRTIQEEYRLEGHEIYSKAAKRVGLTYATCYEYKYARDEQGEIINKVGVSIGADYLSADQCHGHRVPMFTRDMLEERFREVKECPPSGCLTCGDEQPAGVGPCGSELFSAAKALKMSDFKHGVYEQGDPGPVRMRVDPDTLVQIKVGRKK